MMNEVEFENALERLSATKRAKAPANILANIEAKLVMVKVVAFSRREWYVAAAAVGLILVLNISALVYNRHTSTNNLAQVETEPVFNNYELYE